MKPGIIMETNEPEKGHQVKLFLMGAGVEIESITGGPFNAINQIDLFVHAGGMLLACARA